MVPIEILGLTRRFDPTPGRRKPAGSVSALKGVDLSIRGGELLAIVGPSGSGKSTLLNLIAGLDAPSAGTIQFDHRDVTSASPRDRDVALLTQGAPLLPHRDVRGNVSFGLELRGASREEIRRRVEETARRLDMVELLDRSVRGLSGGERQRVALARALVRRPRALLLDEPFAALDPNRKRSLADCLRITRSAHRCTTLLVTHDPAEALSLGERVAVLHGGELRALGTPAELLRRRDDPELGDLLRPAFAVEWTSP